MFRLFRRRPSAVPPREWQGGSYRIPVFVPDREERRQPWMVLWVEPSSSSVLAMETVALEDRPGALARSLQQALQAPLAGPRRRPGRLKVNDEELARELEPVVGEGMELQVAPTPELDGHFARLLEDLAGAGVEPGYLQDGRIEPELVARFFDAAATLYRLQPWEGLDDEPMLRVDIPSRGIVGGFLSIIGCLGESRGLVLFDSVEVWQNFAELEPDTPLNGIDLGGSLLGLEFEPRSSLDEAMQAELDAHGWQLAGPQACPLLERRDRALMPCRPGQDDLELMTALLNAVVALILRHPSALLEDGEPVCEAGEGDDGIRVRLTAPYHAWPLFAVNEPVDDDAALMWEEAGEFLEDPGPPPEPFHPRAGRNEPCPCGSGRKYKKCHLRPDREQHEVANATASASAAVGAGEDAVGPHPAPGPLEGSLMARLLRYAEDRFGQAWWRHEKDLGDEEGIEQLSLFWAFFVYFVDGRTVLEHFLRDRKASRGLAREERAWLEAQGRGWLSIWEVLEVDPGRGLRMRDRLSGEEREVSERSASRQLVVRDTLLCRVVDREGASFLYGVHPRALGPVDAAEVERRARGRLRRRRQVPVERLRDGDFGAYLLRRWREAVRAVDARARMPRALQNTDGDPLQWTVDRFVAPVEHREELARRLAAIAGIDAPEPGDDPQIYHYAREGSPTGDPDGQTLLARLWLEGPHLVAESNSRRRADRLRKLLLRKCEGLLGAITREHPEEPAKGPAASGPRASARAGLRPEELREFALEYKRRHYASWPDIPLPALDNRTPREAVRSKSGRSKLDLLLRDMEHAESRHPGPGGFDFSGLRKELGLDN